jgi:O-antigen ligase
VVIGRTPVVRLSSAFFDWNIFAGYVIILLALSLSMLAGRTIRQGHKFRLLLYACLAAFILFFTFSRSCWIGMFFSLLLLAYAWFPLLKKRKVALVLGGIALLLVLGVVTSAGPLAYIQQRLAMTFEGDASIHKHTIYAQAAMEMFRRCPVFGVGLHNFSTYYTAHFDPNDFGSTAHSAYLSFFAETGLAGALANLCLIFFVLIMTWRASRNLSISQPAYAWVTGLGAAYIGLLAASSFYLFYNQVYLWVLVGLIAAACRISQREDSEHTSGKSTA